MYRWRTDENGIVIVEKKPGIETVPMLSGAAADRFEQRVMRWEDMALAACEPHGVPLAWMMATIYHESLGDPNAVNSETPPGLGLTQITSPSLYRGYTRAEVLIPRVNLGICARHLRRLTESCEPNDWPAIMSAYNAGCAVGGGGKLRPHPSSRTPWGYRCTGSYIDSGVAANNFFIARHACAEIEQPIDPDEVLPLVALTAWDAIGDVLRR